mmetsp:Transcript_48937/g.121436  ORF Transcript_48937/g.121436 Transcript_48937/m.121436 type:complete len:251 (+) Transcript_48937:138-890(+)
MISSSERLLLPGQLRHRPLGTHAHARYRKKMKGETKDATGRAHRTTSPDRARVNSAFTLEFTGLSARSTNCKERSTPSLRALASPLTPSSPIKLLRRLRTFKLRKIGPRGPPALIALTRAIVAFEPIRFVDSVRCSSRGIAPRRSDAASAATPSKPMRTGAKWNSVHGYSWPDERCAASKALSSSRLVFSASASSSRSTLRVFALTSCSVPGRPMPLGSTTVSTVSSRPPKATEHTHRSSRGEGSVRLSW